MKPLFPLALIAALAACAPPDQIADKVGRRTAERVVKPIVDDFMTEPQAEAVTRCIIANATAEEVRAFVRDLGVYPGTATVQSVVDIARRPETRACISGQGLPMLPV